MVTTASYEVEGVGYGTLSIMMRSTGGWAQRGQRGRGSQ